MRTRTTVIIDADEMLDRARNVKPIIIYEGPGAAAAVTSYISGKSLAERATLDRMMIELEQG